MDVVRHYDDTDIAEMVLTLLMNIEEKLKAEENPQRKPELDRVRAWCPPELRYGYKGKKAS